MAATKHAKSIKSDTKECITTAIIQLLEKETLSNITVSQVCKRAGVSRMAFYRNYDGLEQVLYEYYHPRLIAVFNSIRKKTSDTMKLEIQLSFFDTVGEFLLSSVDRGFEPIVKQIFMEEIERFYAHDKDEYWIAFMSAGVYMVWRKWLLDGRKKPLKEIMELIKKFNDAEAK